MSFPETGQAEVLTSDLERLRKLYTALRHISRSMVRTTDRAELFRNLCEAIVEHGGFLMAWVGIDHPDLQMLAPVAQRGDDGTFLNSLVIHTDERADLRSPELQALLVNEPCVCNEFEGDAVPPAWREQAARRGIRSAAGFPVRSQKGFCGTLTVYSAVPRYFGAEEVAMLEQVATDVAFAIDNLARDEERRAAEEVVQRFVAIVESSSDAILSKTLDGTITSWNPAATRMFGYRPEEIIGRNILLLIPPEQHDEETQILARLAAGERISDLETIRVRRNGEFFPASLTISPLFSADGEVVGASKIVRDITGRKQTEAALSEEQARFAVVIQRLDEGFIVADTDGGALTLNAAALRMFGFDTPESCPARMEDFYSMFEVHSLDGVLIPTDQWPPALVFAGQSLHDLEVRVRRIGTDWTRIFSYTGSTVEYAPGKRLAYLTSRDVTERKLAEETLAASARELRNAQRIARVGNWQLELPSREFRCSEEMFRIYGIDPDEFRGTPEEFTALVHPVDREGALAVSLAALAGEAELDHEHRIVLADGTLKLVHIRGALLRDALGQPVRLAGTAQDITERMLAQDALREANLGLEQRVRERTAELAIAKERAESADRLKSAFLATMSHELRTPLNSIIGFTGIILQELAGPINEEQSRQLQMVRGSARHLLALINDVLDISKIEAGQLEVRRSPFDIGDSVERTLATLRPVAAKKGLALLVEAPEQPGAMTGDQRRVEQVLLNLLNNAIKFTERGHVKLTVEILPAAAIAGRAPLPCVCFRVADTGIGVTAADLPTLFQPFRQIDTGISRQHEGTGLGLAICRRLVSLMGGEISVRSEYGSGSEFSFVLPLHNEVNS